MCIYCASSATIDKSNFDATERPARELLKVNIAVVCGGGRIKGIMPKFVNEVEWAHKGLSDIELTETMHERKAKSLKDVDGLVALPDGTGTLGERFMHPRHLEMWAFVDEPEDVLPAIRNAAAWSREAMKFAVNRG